MPGGRENAQIEDPFSWLQSSFLGLANACCLDDTQRMTALRRRGPAPGKTRQADPKWPTDPNPRWPSGRTALAEIDTNAHFPSSRPPPIKPLKQPKPRAEPSAGGSGYQQPLGFGTPAKHLHRVRPVSGAGVSSWANEQADTVVLGGGGQEEILLPEGFVLPRADEKRDRSAGVGIAFEAIAFEGKTSLFVAAVKRQGLGSLPEPSVFIGDELIGVDGTNAGSLAPALVQERMLGPPGSVCLLQLRGEGGQGDRLVAVHRRLPSDMGSEFCYPMRPSGAAQEQRRAGATF